MYGFITYIISYFSLFLNTCIAAGEIKKTEFNNHRARNFSALGTIKLINRAIIMKIVD